VPLGSALAGKTKQARRKAAGPAVFFALSSGGSFGYNPNVAKAGAIQSQGAKGAAVVIYCNPLATPDLDCSGFPARGTT